MNYKLELILKDLDNEFTGSSLHTIQISIIYQDFYLLLQKNLFSHFYGVLGFWGFRLTVTFAEVADDMFAGHEFASQFVADLVISL